MSGRRRYGLICLLLAALSIPGKIVAQTEPIPTEIDAVFADYDNTVSPGCALGVILDGELIYKRGYGMANLELGVALSPRSVFRTGSVGKQFTAMAIAILAEKGTISLDDSLSKHFPEFPDWAEMVTIRHLVHHTSGVRDYLTLTWLAGMGDDDYYTDEFALDLLSRQQNLNFQPGEKYLYSNSGYLLLAHLVQRASGRSLREWATENMFDPLDMTDTHFHDDHTHIVPNRASGYAPTENGFRISETTLDMVGDGGVYTTIDDLLHWDRNFYDNKLGNGGPALIQAVTTPGELTTGQEMTYAFGLDVETHRGLKRVSHGGAVGGVRAYSTRYPEQRLATYVLCNRADANPGERAERVAEILLAEVMEPLEQGADPAVPDSIKGVKLDTADSKRLVGHYWNSERMSFWEIVLDDDTLFLVPHPDERYELTPLSGQHLALVTPWTIADLTFTGDRDQGLQMTYVNRGDTEPSIYQQFEPRSITDAEIRDYLGTYYSDELYVEYVIAWEDESLTFQIGRNGPQPLAAKLDEMFHNPDYGVFSFMRTEDGQVTGFSLDAGRVRNLGFTRR
jgi:CubicO group peptidase (beta-lactamase class C family)